MKKGKNSSISLTVFTVLLSITVCFAQKQDSLFDKSYKTFVAIPIVNNSLTMKTGFGAMGMYFLRIDADDSISPPSIISLIGLYTTNKSHVVIPMAKLFWNDDNNRLTIGGGNLRINNNLRGYTVGKYKGLHMVAIQAEYRWQFYKRWGAVFFAYTESIWGDEENNHEFAERVWLPSGGLGARFMVSREKKNKYQVDYARGVDGNQGLYVCVMEAF